jgi:hypothetical protein
MYNVFIKVLKNKRTDIALELANGVNDDFDEHYLERYHEKLSSTISILESILADIKAHSQQQKGKEHE